jgi:hypothetical protein
MIFFTLFLGLSVVKFKNIAKSKKLTAEEEKKLQEIKESKIQTLLSKFNRDYKYLDKNYKKLAWGSTCPECLEVDNPYETVIQSEQYKYSNKDGSANKKYSKGNNPLVQIYYLNYKCLSCSNTWKSEQLQRQKK